MNSRRIVGRALGDRADQAFASAAFEIALTERMIRRSDGR